MKTTKKILVSAVSGAMVIMMSFGLAGCGDTNKATDTTNQNATNTAVKTVEPIEDDVVRAVDASDPYATGVHHAVLEVEGYEPVTIELNADAAPVTVSNFAKLVEDGYYDGLTFYRFQDGFCMQGGTAGNTASGSDPDLAQIVGEFSSNGFVNPLADDFSKGTVAMARTTDPDSASSTFFVTLGSGTSISGSLNGQYAAFGTISPEDMVIIDKIVADHAEAASSDMMGMIGDEAQQAKIKSIKMID